jgi:transcriptional regulator with XRE-family HTH domain
VEVDDMARRTITLSRPSADALAVLGQQLHQARLERGWTVIDTAGRLGVDPRTVRAIEQGSPTVTIGTVFNAAFLLGVNLFGLDPVALAAARRRGEDTLALLPARVYPTKRDRFDGIDF